MISGDYTEADARYIANHLLEDDAHIERVSEGSTNHLFQISSGERRGDYVKVYHDGSLSSAARKLGISRWPEPEKRAEAEIKASEYLEQAGFETPEAEMLDEDVVLLEHESGIPISLAILGSPETDAERIGQELGNCWNQMRENGWADYDTNPGNYLVERTEEGYSIASIDNEMFREEVPEAVIDSKAADIQENIRDSISRGNNPPRSFYNFVDGFSEGYGKSLELKSGADRVLRDTLDLFRL